MKVSDTNDTGNVLNDAVDPLTTVLTKSYLHRQMNDTIEISSWDQGSLTISFQRTVRVPDNGSQNKLPPSLGAFPLYSVAQFQKTLPANMAVKGGLLFPMYREFSSVVFQHHLAHLW